LVPQVLLSLFFAQSGQQALYETALTFESCNCRATALALARCLADPAQPLPAREEAAESLAYAGGRVSTTREVMAALLFAIQDPNARIRFWAVFALGSGCRRHPQAVPALESVLDDSESPPGNWWPVGREALALLAAMPGAPSHHRATFASAVHRILADPLPPLPIAAGPPTTRPTLKLQL
jgi:hypothetical protein